MRLGDWYYGDNNLIEGSGCILNEHGSENHCYIQEILKNENAAIVFLTKMGEKRRVRLSDLRPEVDAKPWPLPYRSDICNLLFYDVFNILQSLDSLNIL